MIRYIAVMALALMVPAVALGTAVETNAKKGAEMITLHGGSRGEVSFPHRAHQKRQDDCLVCHGLFAQEAGSIEMAKTQGQLAKKQVMNKLCIACHRTERSAGHPSGPTTCSKCHVKE